MAANSTSADPIRMRRRLLFGAVLLFMLQISDSSIGLAAGQAIAKFFGRFFVALEFALDQATLLVADPRLLDVLGRAARQQQQRRQQRHEQQSRPRARKPGHRSRCPSKRWFNCSRRAVSPWSLLVNGS